MTGGRVVSCFDKFDAHKTITHQILNAQPEEKKAAKMPTHPPYNLV